VTRRERQPPHAGKRQDVPAAEVRKHTQRHARRTRDGNLGRMGVHRHRHTQPGAVRHQSQPSGANGLGKLEVGVWGGATPDGTYRDVLQPFTPEVIVTIFRFSDHGMAE
jgi:hypothetical protein